MDLSVIQAYTRLPPDRTEPPAQTQPDPQANESPDAGTDLAENLQDPQPQGQEPQDHHQDTSGPPPQQNPTDHEPDGTQDQDHGQHQDQENAGQQPGDPMEQRGAVLDHPSSQEDTDDSSEELRWDYITHQAITMAERQGKTPGRLEELISRSHAPSLDWRAHLREFMTEFAPSESSWSHPSRRFIARGLYLPGPHADSITSICFAIDTSNSLQTEDLARAWNEIREAADALEPESLRIIQCDAALQDDHTYDGYHLPQELAAKGRRGTDYRPVFETLETEPPAFLIYLTDLECSKYPPVTPNYPVLWICTDPTSQRQPPFGDRIDLPPVS